MYIKFKESAAKKYSDPLCPMVARGQKVDQSVKSRIELFSVDERKEMVAFKCFAFNDLDVSTEDTKCGFKTWSTQAALTRHFKTMLPKSLNDLQKKGIMFYLIFMK